MDASPTLVAARRAAIITAIDAGGAAAAMKIYGSVRPAPGGTPATAPLVTITLEFPCGVVDATGIALADTDYFQALNTGSPGWARIEDSNGNWVADFSAGTDADPDNGPPVAEVTLAVSTIYAGAFIGLVGARLNAAG